MNDSSDSRPPAGSKNAPAAAVVSAADRREPARGPAGHFFLAMLVAVAALALAAWQWFDSNNQLEMLRGEFARKLAEVDAQARESRLVAQRVGEAANEIQSRISVLENKLSESQSQQIALETLYQELSRNRDEWAYADIEQSLFIAGQQLQLAGNVKAALIALQNADLRLQRMERPQLTPLRKAISLDIERLKAVPYVDAVGISVRLDNLVAAVDSLPLAMETRPPPDQAAPADKAEASGAWTRFWREIRDEIMHLVRVQHMDKPDVPLLAPAQSFFLRQNLKLRLIGARLALLNRDQTSYNADLAAASDWLGKYYDKSDKTVAAAAGTLRTLRESEITIELPDISTTLDALRNYRSVLREHGAEAAGQ